MHGTTNLKVAMMTGFRSLSCFPHEFQDSTTNQAPIASLHIFSHSQYTNQPLIQ